MHRRTFTQLLAASAAAAPRTAEVALLTHADGPHLSAYLEGLALCAEVEKVYVVNNAVEAQARKALGAKFVAAYANPAALFQAHKPQLALVPMEATLAAPAIDAALNAGCHVMAEKPACVRAEDFAPLAAKANAKKLHLMLALANRIDPYTQRARTMIAEGALGKIYGMDMQLIADQTRLTRPAYHKTWTAQKSRAGGGYLIWLGIHWLDLAVYITGSQIIQIAGFTGNVGGQPLDTEDAAAVAVKFANGTFGTLSAGYYLDRSKQDLLKIWGEKGWLEIHHDRPEDPFQWQIGSQPVQHWKSNAPAGYTPWVQHVVRAALGLEKPVLSPNESLQALRVVFAGYRAAETGRTQVVF